MRGRRPAVAQVAVAVGQFHQQRRQARRGKAAEVLVLVAVGLAVEGQFLDDSGDLVAETLHQLFHGDRRIFQHVVQHGGRHKIRLAGTQVQTVFITSIGCTI